MQLCTHIQLKQPNFAVFFSSYCNVKRSTESLIQQASDFEQSLSVRESVKLAKSQNMLGLALDCRILVSNSSSSGRPSRNLRRHVVSQAAVPALVQSVKDAGLLLIALGSDKTINTLKQALGPQQIVDGHMTQGLVIVRTRGSSLVTDNVSGRVCVIRMLSLAA